MSALLVGGLFVLAVVSGMLGLGVAFAAVPFLSFFLPDLVHQVQPLSLLLNGVTALFAVFGFAQSGHVDWRKALFLALVTTLFAPLGAWLVQRVQVQWVWWIYLGAVAYLAFNLFRPVKAAVAKENFTLALALAAPISILSGFLGVGPGFLLMPTLILTGHNPKQAAGINAFAVTPPSFSSFLPHLETARLDSSMTITLLLFGALGSYLGSRLTSLYVPPARIKQIFGVLIVLVTLYRVSQL
ncbi:sulfite exporter TauE/SafE family protein [Meiothermus sp.]|uniref:sulfite exporter TauE/SafE family protein n=1 Tax=Meiothermus sp. TaxID=1955249 RepID=UPI0021DC7CA0|nr:sulfite exporter TauE/SafE family protein [Meiothermus sp.]GIW33177.1 MAG: anion permease [Meiothermus sp.]